MLLVKGELTMAHKITPFAKVQKPEEEAKFEVNNRKERRRRNSKKTTAKHVPVNFFAKEEKASKW